MSSDLYLCDFCRRLANLFKNGVLFVDGMPVFGSDRALLPGLRRHKGIKRAAFRSLAHFAEI